MLYGIIQSIKYKKRSASVVVRAVSIASGSKGNCIYVESDNTAVLIDDGLSLKSLESKFKELNINPEKIDAILLTHEHSDHLYGV